MLPFTFLATLCSPIRLISFTKFIRTKLTHLFARLLYKQYKLHAKVLRQWKENDREKKCLCLTLTNNKGRIIVLNNLKHPNEPTNHLIMLVFISPIWVKEKPCKPDEQKFAPIFKSTVELTDSMLPLEKRARMKIGRSPVAMEKKELGR